MIHAVKYTLYIMKLIISICILMINDYSLNGVSAKLCLHVSIIASNYIVTHALMILKGENKHCISIYFLI